MLGKSPRQLRSQQADHDVFAGAETVDSVVNVTERPHQTDSSGAVRVLMKDGVWLVPKASGPQLPQENYKPQATQARGTCPIMPLIRPLAF